MNTWLTIFGMALATYATRVIPLATMRGALHPLLDRSLRYVPPAVFAAMIVPALLAPTGQVEAGATLWAGLGGIATAWLSRNMALTIAAGLGLFALLS